MVSHEEKTHLAAIEKLLGQEITVAKVKGFTEDSDVPDYVLYRPGSRTSEMQADKEIKELVARRKIFKERSRTRQAKGPGAGQGPGAAGKSRHAGKNEPAGKRPARSKARGGQGAKAGKPRGKRR